jgi:uncharacterized repeat protein (TIGR01451 family)
MIKKISLTALLFILIFIGLSMTALAANDTEWVEKNSAVTLFWGDSVTVSGYVIKAEDFSNTSVFISISKDGNKLMNFPLSEGMEMEYDDEIKVSAEKIDPNYETITENGKEFTRKASSNPYAELFIYERGEPELDITVEADKDTYDSKSVGDGTIDATVKVENSGDAEAKSTVLTIDTAGMELLKGKAEYRNTEIHKSEVLKPINLTLKTPTPWEDTDFNISANITCVDIKNKEFKYGGSKTVRVKKKWDLIVSKGFPEERNVGETIPISITVRNKGQCDINNIVLNDSIVSGMHLQENKSLSKTLSLKSGEKAEKILEYSLVPEKSGEFTLPLCVAVFTLPNGQRKEISSNNSGTIKINEPDVRVTKTVDKQQLNIGETLKVVITAQNNRKVNLNVRVNDTLPPGAKLTSGETSSKQILKSEGGSMNINYTLQMNTEGEIKLPACRVNFTDVAKNSVEVASETPIVHVLAPFSSSNNTTEAVGKNESSNKTDGKNETSQAVNNSSSSGQLGGNNGNNGATPGYDLIPSVIVFLVVSGLLRKKYLRRRSAGQR